MSDRRNELLMKKNLHVHRRTLRKVKWLNVYIFNVHVLKQYGYRNSSCPVLDLILFHFQYFKSTHDKALLYVINTETCSMKNSPSLRVWKIRVQLSFLSLRKSRHLMIISVLLFPEHQHFGSFRFTSIFWALKLIKYRFLSVMVKQLETRTI